MATITTNAITVTTGLTNPPGGITLAAAVAAGDRIVYVVASERGGTNSVATVSSVPARTWTKYTSFQNTGTLNNTELEIWYADNPTLITAGGLTVSCTFTAVPDDWYQGVYSATSSNGVVAWDADGPFISNAASTGAVPSVTGINTASAVASIQYFLSGSNGALMGAPAGWTATSSASNFAGADHNSLNTGFQNFSSPQTGLTLTSTGLSTAKWVMIVASLVPGGSEVDIPTSTHGIGISMSATIQTPPLPSLNAGLGITFTVAPPVNFPVAKIVPAPFLLGITEAYDPKSGVTLPAVNFSLGLSVQRWQITQQVQLAASMGVGLTATVIRFGTTLPLPAVTMNIGINSNLPLITGGLTRQIHTVIDAGT